MLINFNGGDGVTPAQVQEMIDTALTKYQRVLNVVSASAEELKSGVTIPNYCVFAINYSGKTYFEQYREETDSGNSVVISFYVPSAAPLDDKYYINDKIYKRKINKTTGASTNASIIRDYAPGVFYDIDKMSTGQESELAQRILAYDVNNNDNFTAKWWYNNKLYTRIGSQYNALNHSIVGLCECWDENRMYLDIRMATYISSQGVYVIGHYEIYFNIDVVDPN